MGVWRGVGLVEQQLKISKRVIYRDCVKNLYWEVFFRNSYNINTNYRIYYSYAVRESVKFGADPWRTSICPVR